MKYLHCPKCNALTPDPKHQCFPKIWDVYDDYWATHDKPISAPKTRTDEENYTIPKDPAKESMWDIGAKMPDKLTGFALLTKEQLKAIQTKRGPGRPFTSATAKKAMLKAQRNKKIKEGKDPGPEIERPRNYLEGRGRIRFNDII